MFAPIPFERQLLFKRRVSMFTYELLEYLQITEGELRGLIRRGHVHPKKLSNNMFFWPDEEIEKLKGILQAKERNEQNSN